jgi:hypothetical protein
MAAIAGIGLYPTLSLCLFFTLFVGMLWKVSRLLPRDLEEAGALPLDGEPSHADSERDDHE